jgi:hypothetical protein
MLLVKKCDDRYKGQFSFLLQVEVQHGNRIDCSFGAVFDWWRGLGLLSLAWLVRLHQERVTMLLDPISG